MQYALSARDRYKALRIKLNEDLSPIRMRISQLTNQLETYAGALTVRYPEEFQSFRGMATELETLKTLLEDSVAEIDADVIRKHSALLSDSERAPLLSVREIVRLAGTLS